MEMRRSQHDYFDDVANYLIVFISVTLTTELYIRGSVGKYLSNHTVGLQAKQTGMWLRFYPNTLLDDFFRGKQPVVLLFEEERAKKPPADAVLKLGIFERPLLELAQWMFVDYFERRRVDIETQYGQETTSWPQEWNFGRVIRNSFVHKTGVYFENPSALPVQWRSLIYSPSDNGRKIMNGDLWPADLIYLTMDMDSYIT